MGREDYSAIQADRITRMHERAEKAGAASTAAYEASRRMSEVLPFGQPILVGHHSERAHRNLIKRIGKKMDASGELSKKADDLSSRAASAEMNTAISSDDPNAIDALRKKLAGMIRNQESMKAVNKIIASKPKYELTSGKIEQIVAMGYTEKTAVSLLEPDFCRRIGFPGYALSNNNANIARVKRRIEQLEKVSALHDERVEYEGFALVIDTALNRVQIDFRGRDAYQRICKDKGINLRSYGFVFSQRDGNCWQRKITGDAIRSAKRVAAIMSEAEKGGAE